MTNLITLLLSAPSALSTYHWFSAFSLGLYDADVATAAALSVLAHALTSVPFAALGGAVVVLDAGAGGGQRV